MPNDDLPDLGVELRGIKHQMTLMNLLAFYRTLDPNTTTGREMHGVIDSLLHQYLIETAKESDI